MLEKLELYILFSHISMLICEYFQPWKKDLNSTIFSSNLQYRKELCIWHCMHVESRLNEYTNLSCVWVCFKLLGLISKIDFFKADMNSRNGYNLCSTKSWNWFLVLEKTIWFFCIRLRLTSMQGNIIVWPTNVYKNRSQRQFLYEPIRTPDRYLKNFVIL